MKKKESQNTPKKSTVPKKPQNWDIVVSSAYLRMLGGTREEAAEPAGCSVRQLQEWEKAVFWPVAMAEARSRWLRGVEQGAMRGILEGLGDPNEYAGMSRWAAERVIPELAPPKNKLEHTGKDGDTIKIESAVKIYLPDNGRCGK